MCCKFLKRELFKGESSHALMRQFSFNFLGYDFFHGCFLATWTPIGLETIFSLPLAAPFRGLLDGHHSNAQPLTFTILPLVGVKQLTVQKITTIGENEN